MFYYIVLSLSVHSRTYIVHVRTPLGHRLNKGGCYPIFQSTYVVAFEYFEGYTNITATSVPTASSPTDPPHISSFINPRNEQNLRRTPAGGVNQRFRTGLTG